MSEKRDDDRSRSTSRQDNSGFPSDQCGVWSAWLVGAVSWLELMVKWKTAPRGSFALAHSRPPCAATMERQIESPSPKPVGLVVKKASKKRSSAAEGRPGPESCTVTSTPPD